jgi:hypothetical protein
MLESYQHICCRFIVAQIWENRKSYFNGLQINIGTYVERITYLCQLSTIWWNLDRLEYRLYNTEID